MGGVEKYSGGTLSVRMPWISGLGSYAVVLGIQAEVFFCTLQETAMPPFAQIVARILLVTQSAWLIAPAQAQAAQPARSQTAQMHTHHHHRHMAPTRPMPGHRQGAARQVSSIGAGSFFKLQHQETARAFYSEPEHQGYCALAKGTDCAPLGTSKLWQLGLPLSLSVMRYRLPRPLEIRLGPPPAGHHYVRVGADILLLNQGTSEVVDVMENAVH